MIQCEKDSLKSLEMLVESQQAAIHALLKELKEKDEELVRWKSEAKSLADELYRQVTQVTEAHKEITDLSQALEKTISELERLKTPAATCNVTRTEPAEEKPTQAQNRNKNRSDNAKTVLIFKSIFPY